eukprot:14262678-Alexandrium_andersonii.AAC.1
MPWPAALLMVQDLAATGLERDLHAARLIPIAFDGYLRPGSAVEVKGSDVVKGKLNHRGSPFLLLRIRPPDFLAGDLLSRRTKSGQYDDHVTYGEAASEQAGRGT